MNEHGYRAPDGHCSQEGCQATYRDHRWGQTAAVNAGWLLQRNGDAWCPEHLPDWVQGWRARKARGSG